MQDRSNRWAKDWYGTRRQTNRMSIRYYDFMNDGFFEVAIDKKLVGDVSVKGEAALEIVRLGFGWT